jgi:hypothetical protein
VNDVLSAFDPKPLGNLGRRVTDISLGSMGGGEADFPCLSIELVFPAVRRLVKAGRRRHGVCLYRYLPHRGDKVVIAHDQALGCQVHEGQPHLVRRGAVALSELSRGG